MDWRTGMNDEAIELQVRVARQRTLELVRRSAGGSAAEVFPEALEELQSALEELSVSEEELRQQNEELVATRAVLEAERQRYHDLFEFAPDAYLITTPGGDVREANRAATVLLKRSQRSLTGKPLVALVAQECRLAFRHHLERLCAEPDRREWEVRLELDAETTLEAEVAAVPVRDISGETVALRWLLRDVTTRRQTERLAAIGQTVSGLAHEARGALQRSLACLERLRWRLADQPESLDLVDRAGKGLDELRRLFEDVRDFAAPVQLRPERCELDLLWREAWADLAPSREGQRLELCEEIGGSSTGCLADSFLIRQVFRNVLANALDACPDPARVVVACADAILDAGPAVRVAVRDNGPGFSEVQRQKAFEPFYTTKPRGTGLGLSLRRRVVEAHGGTIGLGPPGPNAEVLITLPRRLG